MALYFAISNDGQLNTDEMLRELAENQICPIMTYEEDNQKVVPVFSTVIMAQKFAKRNTPKEYSIGTMEIKDDDQKQLKDSGYIIEQLHFPKKRKIVVHVMHLNRQVETHNRGFRRNIK